jgi:hypothetical protein
VLSAKVGCSRSNQYSGHFWERAVSLTAYAPVESGYFIQVSLLPDLNKMMLKDGDPLSAVIPIAENCPEYCLIRVRPHSAVKSSRYEV